MVKKETAFERVAFILDQFPTTRSNYLLLLLVYWQLFDNIQIPPEVAQQILDKATQPETIDRTRRRVSQCAYIKDILEHIKDRGN